MRKPIQYECNFVYKVQNMIEFHDIIKDMEDSKLYLLLLKVEKNHYNSNLSNHPMSGKDWKLASEEVKYGNYIKGLY